MSLPKPELGAPLDDNELKVLELLPEGYTNIEIGRKLFMAENTVKMWVYRIGKKLGARGRANTVWLAIAKGLLAVPSVEAVKPVLVPRPEHHKHIAACFAAEACPCRRAVAS